MIDIHRHAIERLPRLRVVTILALQGESDKQMIRLCGPVEILRVAALALERQSCVLSTDMAFLTLRAPMRSGQSEIRQIVIEFRGTPRLHIVTAFTVLRKLSADVIRETRRFVIGFVTSPAFLREFGKSAGVTSVTGCGRVRTAQGKFCSRMIKGRRLPVFWLMTCEAIPVVLPGCMIGFFHTR